MYSRAERPSINSSPERPKITQTGPMSGFVHHKLLDAQAIKRAWRDLPEADRGAKVIAEVEYMLKLKAVVFMHQFELKVTRQPVCQRSSKQCHNDVPTVSSLAQSLVIGSNQHMQTYA